MTTHLMVFFLGVQVLIEFKVATDHVVVVDLETVLLDDYDLKFVNLQKEKGSS